MVFQILGRVFGKSEQRKKIDLCSFNNKYSKNIFGTTLAFILSIRIMKRGGGGQDERKNDIVYAGKQERKSDTAN